MRDPHDILTAKRLAADIAEEFLRLCGAGVIVASIVVLAVAFGA